MFEVAKQQRTWGFNNQLKKSGEALRTFTFEAPMRLLDVERNMYLDYTTTQSIKFYNKGCEKLPGDPFNGKMLMTWLVQVQVSYSFQHIF